MAINNTTDNEQAAFILYCGSCKTITAESDGIYNSDWEDTEDEEEYLTVDEKYDSNDDNPEAEVPIICNICKEAKEVGGDIKTRTRTTMNGGKARETNISINDLLPTGTLALDMA